jgi:flavin-dependent dehydrogenase
LSIIDVVIVGAGPAGCAAAVALAQAGRSAVVIDKATFPRDKFCGDGLTAGALRHLEALGLDPLEVRSWHRVDDIIVRAPSGREVEFPLPRRQGQFAVVARRFDLDYALVKRARAVGATIHDGHPFRSIGFGITRDARTRTGAMKTQWPALLATEHIAAALGEHATAESPHRAWPIPARVNTIPLTARRTLFVGDAAAATDLMTGEGIAQALLTGMLAAQACITGIDDAAVRQQYERAVGRALFADHRMSAALQSVMARPRALDAAVRVAGASSWTRRNFARWLFEDYPRAVLLTPRRWRREMFGAAGAFS